MRIIDNNLTIRLHFLRMIMVLSIHLSQIFVKMEVSASVFRNQPSYSKLYRMGIFHFYKVGLCFQYFEKWRQAPATVILVTQWCWRFWWQNLVWSTTSKNIGQTYDSEICHQRFCSPKVSLFGFWVRISD